MSAGPVVGVGVHSGERCSVRLHREDGPIRFRLGRFEVAACAAAVVATPRCTVLGDDGVRIATVEHRMAALRVGGFWSGVVVEVDARELPILDGSAEPWTESVSALGPPPPAPPTWHPRTPVAFGHGRSRFVWRPGEERLEVAIDYAHRAIGAQRWAGTPASYRDVLGARTFATAEEVHALRAEGGLKGAEEGRGIVFADDGPSTPLRWPDEPVRHKALDALGDIALLGRPLGGSLSIERGSHAAHVSFMLHLSHHLPPDVGPDPT